MNKILFIFSNVIVIIGVCVLFITSLINKVMPKIGYAAFQASAAGSYSPDEYVINFTMINSFAIALIVIGCIAIYQIYKKTIS